MSLISRSEKIVVAQAFLKENVSLRAEVRVKIEPNPITCDSNSPFHLGDGMSRV